MAVKKTQEKRYYILEHKLVPKHEILSEKEKKDLLTKYDITADQLPKIVCTDPAASSIGAVPGQIVKIKRDSRTAKYTTSYRLVIESE